MTKKKLPRVRKPADDAVHIDATGEAALLVRTIALRTGWSNNVAGNYLLSMIAKMEMKLTLELKEQPPIQGGPGKQSTEFQRTSQTIIQVDLGELS